MAATLEEGGMRNQLRLAVCSAALALAGVCQAQTGAYPNQPVRMIVPFAAGGPTDVIARVVGQKLSESL